MQPVQASIMRETKPPACCANSIYDTHKLCIEHGGFKTAKKVAQAVLKPPIKRETIRI